MKFRIARDIGCTVAELGDRLSVSEYFEWLEFYQVEHEENERAIKEARQG